MKRVACLLLISMTLFTSKARAAEYWISPVLAVYPGLGVGHFVEGRAERGLTFFVLEAATLGGAAFFFGRGFTLGNSSRSQDRDMDIFAVFALAWLGVKVWQIVDVIAGPSKSAMLLPMPVNGSPGLMLSSRF
jgi:hypothetical protein